jgi:penicillin V acylase-like amidase (Ntn superfamily)
VGNALVVLLLQPGRDLNEEHYLVSGDIGRGMIVIGIGGILVVDDGCAQVMSGGENV